MQLGVASAENNRLLAEEVALLQRSTGQCHVLREEGSCDLMRQDLRNVERRLQDMSFLTEQADATEKSVMIGREARAIVRAITAQDISAEAAEAALSRFGPLRREVAHLTSILATPSSTMNCASMQESTSSAQQISAWQVAALLPGTLLLVLFFTLLIGRPIRQIDNAIHQLGQSGFSKPIIIKGPTDLERLGRQLEWLRVRLLELAQEKNRFLRHMSHELKTPAGQYSRRHGTAARWSGRRARQAAERSHRHPAHERAQTAATDREPAELQRVAGQERDPDAELTFPLRALVISVAKEQRLALKAAGIQLRLEVEDIIVNADREKIRTVLDNLLSNAVKFTPKGGMVTIRAKRESASFVIDFADTGPGIPDEERSRIFEAFFQGTREQGGHVAGTGIGLSVVLECIQAHEGMVDLVDSEEF